MFYRTEEPNQPTEVFVEMPDGVYGVTLTATEVAGRNARYPSC